MFPDNLYFCCLYSLLSSSVELFLVFSVSRLWARSVAIPVFQETKRPSKEMQVTIARQLGLEPTTVGNFFMNARRRSMDKWRDETDDVDDFEQEGDDQNANIKYEVYECGEPALGEAAGGYQEYQDSVGLTDQLEHHSGYHNMTVVPGPVHNMQFPPTCT